MAKSSSATATPPPHSNAPAPKTRSRPTRSSRSAAAARAACAPAASARATMLAAAARQPRRRVRRTQLHHSARRDAERSLLWQSLGTLQLRTEIYGGAGIAGADIDATLAWDVTHRHRAPTSSASSTPALITTTRIWPRTSGRRPARFRSRSAASSSTAPPARTASTRSPTPAIRWTITTHGTHVAGTIGAVGNNGFGVTGVNWTASMMGLKFLRRVGSGSTSRRDQGHRVRRSRPRRRSARDANVRILSNSWGGGGYSQRCSTNQIDAANTADMLFVAAAGNCRDQQRSDSALPVVVHEPEHRQRGRHDQPRSARVVFELRRHVGASRRTRPGRFSRPFRMAAILPSTAPRWRRRMSRARRRSCSPPVPSRPRR